MTRPLHIVQAPAEPAHSSRTELADLISLAREAKEIEADTKEKLRKAKARVLECIENLERVRNAITSAKEALSVKYASSEVPPTVDRSLREARAAELDALDNLDIVQGALGSLEADVAKAELVAKVTDHKVALAARAVIAAQAPKLLAETKTIQQDLVRRRIILRAMVHELEVTGPEMDQVISFLRDTDLPGSFGTVSYGQWDNHPVALPWKDALARLMTDPNTPLPE